MQCPACKQSIDDDSLHCDQCGIELMQCPRCGHLGKGKRCPADGTALVSRKGATPPGAPPGTPPGPPAGTGTGTGTDTGTGTGTGTDTSSGTAVRRLRLRSVERGVDLSPASGTVLGRRFGPHADVLSRFAQVSSQHLELRQDDAGTWQAKDLNSYNHSFLNGRQMTPGVEQPLAAGDLLALGDVVLTVELE